MIFKQQSSLGFPDVMRTVRPRMDYAERAVMQWATIEEYDRVLDVDCKEGALLGALEDTYRVSLCGMCPSARKARAVREDFPGGDILYGRPVDIPFRSESFDEVFITRNTVKNCVDTALLEMFRVLKPGGQLIVAHRGLKMLMADGDQEMARREIMRALQSAGFSDVSWRSAGLCGVIIGWKKRTGC